MTDAEIAQSSDATNRIVITACVMAATLMQTLDTTIVNIAMPYNTDQWSSCYCVIYSLKN